MIIVDTNVILAFLLTDGITRRIISGHKDTFIVPDFCFDELWEHRSRWNIHNLEDEDLERIIEKVKMHFIPSIDKKHYRRNLQKAKGVIRDKEDAPVLALALSIENEGIWTYNPKDFDTEEIRSCVEILSTGDVLKLYPIGAE